MNGWDLFLKSNGWSWFTLPLSQRKFSPINKWLHTHKRVDFRKTRQKNKNYSHILSPHLHDTENKKP